MASRLAVTLCCLVQCLDCLGGDLCSSSSIDPGQVVARKHGETYSFEYCQRGLKAKCTLVGRRPSYSRTELEDAFLRIIAERGSVGIVAGPTIFEDMPGMQALDSLTFGAPSFGWKAVYAIPLRESDAQGNKAKVLGAALAAPAPGACRTFNATSRNIKRALEEALNTLPRIDSPPHIR